MLFGGDGFCPDPLFSVVKHAFIAGYLIILLILQLDKNKK